MLFLLSPYISLCANNVDGSVDKDLNTDLHKSVTVL